MQAVSVSKGRRPVSLLEDTEAERLEILPHSAFFVLLGLQGLGWDLGEGSLLYSVH